MSMLIQIYEIGTPAEAVKVAGAGVHHVGVLVGNGEFPREITIQNAMPILEAIPSTSKKVALTLSRDRKAIEEIAAQLQPDILHLGTLPESLSPKDVVELKKRFPGIRIMRSIPVISKESIELAKSYDGIADYLLLDSYRKEDNQVGATGATHDWRISKKIVASVSIPVILAGGLGPENVADAIRQVRPAGVDSKTKTDKTGSHKKDIEKINRFVHAATTAR